MIHAIESISEFIKLKTSSDLSGISTPNMKFAVRANNEPPDFVNCLNVYFYDVMNVKDTQLNPHYRLMGSSMELLLKIDPLANLKAMRDALLVAAKIDQFMGVQTIAKKNYSVTPVANLNSAITWRESYPLEWRPAANQDERYYHLTTFVQFRFFQEKIVV